MAELFWLLLVAGGAGALGLIIAYVLVTRRRLSAREQIVRDSKVERLYDESVQGPERH